MAIETANSSARSVGADDSAAMLAPGVRSAISLLLFFHLFIVAVVLAGNFAPSQLQARLLRFFTPYTQPLNLDLNFTPFQLTHASIDDVDHRLEILPETAAGEGDENWVVLPTAGSRCGERYKRYQRLATAMAFFAVREDTQTAGLLAKTLAAHSVGQDQVKPKQIRCRKHLLQGMEAIEGGTEQQRNPNDASYFQEVYRANTICLDDGTVEIIRVEGRGQVAGPDAAAPGN